MKIKYDPEVDAAYISFKKGPTGVVFHSCIDHSLSFRLLRFPVKEDHPA
jgi:hypothetical protein